MTREQWLCKKVEEKAKKLTSILNSREEKDKDLITRANGIAMLYSVGRIDPLDYLMFLTRQLTEEEWKKQGL